MPLKVYDRLDESFEDRAKKADGGPIEDDEDFHSSGTEAGNANPNIYQYKRFKRTGLKMEDREFLDRPWFLGRCSCC